MAEEKGGERRQTPVEGPGTKMHSFLHLVYKEKSFIEGQDATFWRLLLSKPC